MSKNNKVAKTQKINPTAKPVPKKQCQDSKLQKLVKSNAHFGFIQNGKIKCTLTGHEFAPTLENFEEYLKSKSYKKGLESQFDISDYEEFLVPFKRNPHFLFCRLTAAKIPNKKTAIERHVNSRKFKTRLQKLLADQEEEGPEELVEEEEDDIEEIVEDEEGEKEDEEEEEEEEKVPVKVPVKAKNGGKKKK